MCTLTFIPHKDRFIFTSNRDEHDSRADTLFPVIEKRNGGSVYFPQDPKAGGTWLAVSDQQRISILLNGAFEQHKHRPPYRKSRGLILLDSFNYTSLEQFSKSYDLTDIEPFTIVSFDLHNPSSIEELRWDGERNHLKDIDANQALIWSSAQLYSSDVRKERERWFDQLIEQEPTEEDLSHFHEFGGSEDTGNAINMNRGFGLRTISISQLVLYANKTKFNYRNLLTDTIQEEWIEKQ